MFKGFFRWLRSASGTMVKKSVGSVATATGTGAGLLVALGLAVWAFPPARTLQTLDSVRRDAGIWYSTESEGMIMVDSPQVFTRERLVNQRLKDSAWIEKQLEQVDKLLEDKKFAQADALQLSQKFLELVQEGAEKADASDTLPTVDITELQGLVEPQPLAVFQAAQYYREMLTQSRYEAILDDAHDIGSNTLQRLNFRMTVSPARNMSDAIAAATITIEQPSDPEKIFQYYGSLLVEVRKELERTVETLQSDRSSVFLNDGRYAFQERPAYILDSALDKALMVFPSQQQSDLLAAALQQDSVRVEREAYDFAEALVTGTAPWSGMGEKLFPAGQSNPSTFGRIAAQKLLSQCGQPHSLFDLAPSVFNQSSSTYASVLAGYNKYGPGQITRQGEPLPIPQEIDADGPDTPPGTNNTVNATWVKGSKPPSDQLETLLEARLLEVLHRRNIVYPCPTDLQLSLPRAKLRILGAIELLKARDPGFILCARMNAGDARQLVSSLIALRDPNVPDITSPFCAQTRMAVSALKDTERFERLMRPGSTVEIGNVGVSYLVKAELEDTRVDSVVRTRPLSHYFKFEIESCEISSCQVSVYTLMEYAETREHPKTGDAYNLDRIREIGREEALRLFLELSCFSTARSYTVWPRTGERARSFRSDRDGWTMLADLVPGIAGRMRTENFAATREHSDHVFGIGDWGETEGEEDIEECGSAFFWILEQFQPLESENGFAADFFDETSEFWDGAPAGMAAWRRNIFCGVMMTSPLAKEVSDESCLDPAVSNGLASVEPVPWIGQNLASLSLDDIARVGAKQRHIATNISWIVVPRQPSRREPKRHISMSVPLSAIVSLPSWWPTAEATIKTCWLRPAALRENTRTADFCENTVVDRQTRTGLELIDRQRARSRADRSLHRFPIPLPGDGQDVLQKLGFFIIRAPYLDVSERDMTVIQSGRSASVRLTGKRLWKNPRVRIGNQWHDRIEVLPDMQGIIATFECVAPTSTAERALYRITRERLLVFDTDQPGGKALRTTEAEPNGNRPLDDVYEESRRTEVWTSEGVTSPLEITVEAFRPSFVRNGQAEMPCWAKLTEDELEQMVAQNK
ncbi:hypothetical protein [Litoreibacter roseus]|uniref:Uncharacterized protein n=1 Tax=Litoreibacter roseus TaxID=2601869 RepID=A0A6N6JIL9_9RHOB|nr:hypothetical protein [Litoreibacter roseus]GFE65787.1 hypothetical protein KIN_28610 [Litoreibacter roseus]